MGNLEKYGVLALIFVIVLILTVAIWNGPAPPKPTEVAKVDPPRPTNPEPQPAPANSGLNSPIPAPSVPTGPVMVDAKPQFRTYTVEKNDNLASIAKKMLGSSARWTDIAKANEGLDPKRLRIGQSILVPFSEEEARVDAKPDAKDEPKAAKGRVKSQKLASR